MKKDAIFSQMRLFLAPGAVILAGLLLLLNPDFVSGIISRLLGYGLMVAGIGFGISAFAGSRSPAGKLLTALALLWAGSLLIRNPLLLAAFAGRVIGLLLVIDGVQDIFAARARGSRFVMPGIVAGLGVLLILMPMTASRLAVSLVGVAVLIVGILMLLDRLRTRRPGRGEDRPDIIDAL